MNEERRREPRLDVLPLDLFVYDNLNDRILGTLVNVSNHGMMILASTQCDPGGVLQVDLRNADSPDHPILSAGIKATWVSAANTPGNYWIGGRIIGIEKEDARQLAQIIQRARDIIAAS